MRRREARLVSVVAPTFNEEATIHAFYDRVCGALSGVPFELVVVDDGSTDRTWEILTELAAKDDRVKIIRLSRNFGHQTALTCGLDHAGGDAVAMLDADLQDPPELIRELLEHWREGVDVVFTVRSTRSGESRFKLLTAKWFYRLVAKISSVPLQRDAGDFRLLDRRALDSLLLMRESNRYLRGMSVWIGFTQMGVCYDRDVRFAGETKFSLSRMVRFSLDAIASFSHAPLQVATMVGFLCAAVAFLLIPVAVVFRIFGQFVPGVTTTIVAILMLGGIQLMAVGLIGEYVGRIYEEVKRRPLYVVQSATNLADDPAARPS